MLLQSSPFIIPLAVSTLVALVLALMSWRRQETPGSQLFFVVMLGIIIWSLLGILELSVVDLATKITFGKITYFGIVSSIGAWAAFAFQRTGYERWLTRRTFTLMLIEPTFVLLAVMTNESHHLFWPHVRLAVSDGLIVGDYSHGIIFWIHAIYSYGLLLLTTILLGRWLLKTQGIYRWQAIAMLISIFAPWIGNALYLTGVSVVDLTPFGFTITGLAMAWGMLRFRLLDIVPIARETVIENMPDALWVIDAQYRILELNPAAAEIAGTTRRWTGVDLNEALPEVTELVKVNSNRSHEVMLMRSNATRFFEVQTSPVYDSTFRLRGYTVLMHDVTERKQAGQRIEKQNADLEKANQELDIARLQAEEATRLKSQFLATMSHELRTPLTAIMGYTEIQLAGMAGELLPEQRSYQERVLANADHLLRLINEILDLAKIEAGRTDIVTHPFNVQAWLDEVVLQTEGLAKQKGLAFEHVLDNSLPPQLVGDSARLKQIVINLLSNASKFTEKGFVRLEVCRDDEHTWSIRVSDSGIGIPPHMQNIIFEEFRQVDNSSTRNYGGTGLGLAIVRKLVLLMGGHIRLQSQLGQGSTFTITLPMNKVQTATKHEEMTA
ncbi:MAG: histidine kinase N-terminal 7TM domain-containing protein [Anaerolineae bacterium]